MYEQNFKIGARFLLFFLRFLRTEHCEFDTLMCFILFYSEVLAILLQNPTMKLFHVYYNLHYMLIYYQKLVECEPHYQTFSLRAGQSCTLKQTINIL